MAAKKRNYTKPQGTLSVDDVTNLHLALWQLRDAIVTGNLQAVDAASLAIWRCIPNTTTNDGARTRARNLYRKQQDFRELPKTERDRFLPIYAATSDHCAGLRI